LLFVRHVLGGFRLRFHCTGKEGGAVKQ
jgi:hypothetical protein